MKKKQEVKTEVKPGIKKSDIKMRIVFLIAGILISGAACIGTRKLMPEKPTVEKQLFVLTNEVNKNCPVMIDNGTRFDNVILMPGNVFQYRYTLINAERGNIDTEALKKYVLPNVVQNIRSSADLKYQRENKITFSYYYRDGHGDYILDFPVTAAQYEMKADTMKADTTKAPKGK